MCCVLPLHMAKSLHPPLCTGWIKKKKNQAKFAYHYTGSKYPKMINNIKTEIRKQKKLPELSNDSIIEALLLSPGGAAVVSWPPGLVPDCVPVLFWVLTFDMAQTRWVIIINTSIQFKGFSDLEHKSPFCIIAGGTNRYLAASIHGWWSSTCKVRFKSPWCHH